MFERRRALAQWLIANTIWTPGPEASIQPRTPKGGRWTRGCFNSPEVFEQADRTVERIRSGELDPFDSANRMTDFLREHNKAISTISTARSSLIGFLRYSRLGLDPEDIRLAVKKLRRVRVLASKLPTRDQVRGLLLVAPLKVKVLISMMISTGARIGEIRRVRESDIDFSQNPVYVHFRETKTGVHRIGFLSSETVLLLRQYLKGRKYGHDHIFDGRELTEKGLHMRHFDKPLSHTSAWLSIRRAFQQLEMDQRYDGIHHYYHPHVFRTLCLALLKTGGYPADWAEFLISHSIGTQEAYLPPIEVLAQEWLKLDERFCFLTNMQMQQKQEPVSLQAPIAVSEASKPEEPETHDFQTHRWSSRAWSFVKTTVGSIDYDQALAEGYMVFDKDGPLRIFRKRTVTLPVSQ